jgi:hypothetical protein
MLCEHMIEHKLYSQYLRYSLPISFSFSVIVYVNKRIDISEFLFVVIKSSLTVSLAPEI